MHISEIVNIEKLNFSNIHSEFDKFIKVLNNKNNLTNESLEKIIILNKQMQEITTNLMELKYSLEKPDGKNNSKNNSKNNRKNNSKNNSKNIEDYEKNETAINAFLPYIFYYRFMMN